MTTAVVSALVSLLIAAGSALGWLIRRRDQRADPLPRQAVELTLARDALGIIGASRDALTEDVGRLRADLTDLTDEVHSLRREVRTLRAAWSAWYADLTTYWHRHRAQATPPPPPTLD